MNCGKISKNEKGEKERWRKRNMKKIGMNENE